MKTELAICRNREHPSLDGVHHLDRAECDAFDVESKEQWRKQELVEIHDELGTLRAAMVDMRAEMKRNEQRTAELIREAFSRGDSASRLAATAGLSRERIYQLRDDRR